MAQARIRSCKLTDRNGKSTQVYRPTFGSMTYVEENGRLKIIRKSWLGYKRIIIPAREDRIEIDFDD